MKLLYYTLRFKTLLIIFLLNGLLIIPRTMIAQDQEINTCLMQTTFKIQQGNSSWGTAFILLRPMKADTMFTIGKNVLVTAAHVLNEMTADTIQINLRRKKDDGTYEKFIYPLQIRNKGKPLWIQHDEADVAAMYIKLPKSKIVDLKAYMLPTTLLAGDTTFEKYEIHPGDDLNCLGYTFELEANEAGFPILRSGKIASYPLVPAEKIKIFYYDAEIFPGHSGGPVYFIDHNRTYKGATHIGENIYYIVGLISQAPVKVTITPLTAGVTQLSLAKIVPAQYIIETIEKLQKLK